MNFDKRLAQLKKEIQKQKLDAVIISAALDINYLTGYSNFSTHEREAYLIIAEDNQYLLTDGRYSEAVGKMVKNFEVVERTPNQTLNQTVQSVFKLTLPKKKVYKVGVDEYSLTAFEYKSFGKIFSKMVHFDPHNIRIKKDKAEIEVISQACKLADLALTDLVKSIKTGIREVEYCRQFQNFLKEKDADISFDTIVAFGPNSSVPHHQSGDTILAQKNGSFVLIDFGAKLNDYCSDSTRTFVFGKASQKQKKIYKTVLEAQQKAAEFLDKKVKNNRPVKGKEVDQVARDYIISQGFPAIPHGLGHGIGLEVHEPPRLGPASKDILEEGMVFSIEPGIYIPDFGGVRIEDLYVIENSGIRQLTTSPKELLEF